MRLFSVIFTLLLVSCGGSFDLNINKKDSSDDKSEADDIVDDEGKGSDDVATDADDETDDEHSYDDDPTAKKPTISTLVDKFLASIGSVSSDTPGTVTVTYQKHADKDATVTDLKFDVTKGFTGGDSKAKCYFVSADCSDEFCALSGGDAVVASGEKFFIRENDKTITATAGAFASVLTAGQCAAWLGDEDDAPEAGVELPYGQFLEFKIPFALKPRP